MACWQNERSYLASFLHAFCVQKRKTALFSYYLQPERVWRLPSLLPRPSSSVRLRSNRLALSLASRICSLSVLGPYNDRPRRSYSSSERILVSGSPQTRHSRRRLAPQGLASKQQFSFASRLANRFSSSSTAISRKPPASASMSNINELDQLGLFGACLGSSDVDMAVKAETDSHCIAISLAFPASLRVCLQCLCRPRSCRRRHWLDQGRLSGLACRCSSSSYRA